MIFSKNWVERWHVHPHGKREYDFIDGLRGIAILMVVASHVLWVNPLHSHFVCFIGYLLHSGALGVSLFFVLSGFLIALPFWNRLVAGHDTTPRGFASRRFWKIYPPMALSILILLPYYIIRKGHPEGYSLTALQWLLGLPIVFPVSSMINPVMWSLIYEVQFYITLPIFFLLMRGKSYKETVLASIGVFLLLPLLAWWIYSLLGIQASIHPFIRSNYPSGLMNFPVGVLFAAFFAIGRGSKKLAKIGYLGLLMIMFSVVECAFCFSKTADMSTSPRVLMMLASGGCLFFVFDQSTTAVRYLCMPWLRWLGMISYEWYLLHLPIFHLLWDGKTGGDPLKYLWIVVASGGGSLLLGAFMYRYFSLPILKWARGKASAR